MAPKEKREIENLKADIVVMGSGGGLAAAVAAAEMGATVILLEKVGVLGGYTRLANGLFACESPAQKRLNINITRDEAFKKFIDWNHWCRVDPRIVRAYVNKTGDTIRWLEEKGVQFEVPWLDPNHLPTAHTPVGMGAALQKALIKSAKELGVTALLNTSGKKITLGAKGVTGVLAVREGDEIKIKARAVIIATGGFGDNRVLLKKYCPDYYNEMPTDLWPYRAAHSGDGLLMAQEIGAAIADAIGNYHLGPYYPGYMYPWQPLPTMALNYYTIWLNKRGRRFIKETGLDNRLGGNAIMWQPDRVMYSVFDDEIRRNVEEGHANITGKPRKQAKAGGGTIEVAPEKGLPGLKEELQKQDKLGGTKIAGSWDELADWIGADPQVLKAEIDEYNSFCDRGHDEIFNKEKEFLRQLRTPPYYAMRCCARVGETLGGIKVNEHMEVLDTRGNTIPGAYAAGVIADGFQGFNAYGSVGGSVMGFAVNSGRIAGESAAKYVLG